MESVTQRRLQIIDGIQLSEEGLVPASYVKELAKLGIVHADREQEAVGVILATPTLPAVYEGVALQLEKMIHGGSDVILWTQGDPQLQIAKCDTSKLLDLNDDEDKRGRITVSAHANKVSGVGQELTRERLDGKTHLVFVDDKSPQLLAVYQKILKLGESDHRELPHDILFVWMRRAENTKTNTMLPEGFESEGEFAQFIGGNLVSATKPEDIPLMAHALYFLDVDRTLIDTDWWFRTVQERIALELGAPQVGS